MPFGRTPRAAWPAMRRHSERARRACGGLGRHRARHEPTPARCPPQRVAPMHDEAGIRACEWRPTTRVARQARRAFPGPAVGPSGCVCDTLLADRCGGSAGMAARSNTRRRTGFPFNPSPRAGGVGHLVQAGAMLAEAAHATGRAALGLASAGIECPQH